MSFPWEIDPEHIIKHRKLGKGNFGKVYSGECRSLPVAIKVPRIQDLDEEDLADLKQEVQIWSTKPHPNIVQFIGACTIRNKFQIVTELLDGDLEHLLHSDKQLSLLERMRMAYQVALGMNWLHKSTPAIIHRDLKTANILYRRVGESYEIKLADFGLAQIKPRHVKQLRDPKDGARGTPLYMPPEVLLGQPFDEKADVYSFGVCLWEIVERKDPFSHHTDYDEFKQAVAVNGERPPLSDKFTGRLRSLVERCWHADPAQRPDFETIAAELLPIIVDAAIDDPEGRAFWVSNFLGELRVPWPKFSYYLYRYIGERIPARIPAEDEYTPPAGKKKKKKKGKKGKKGKKAAKGKDKKKKGKRGESSEDDEVMLPQSSSSKQWVDDIVNYRCLKALLARPQDELSVDLTWFGAVLQWFGPLQRNAPRGESFLYKIRDMLCRPWFHGDIDANEAGRRLRGMPEGTFLVRFSLTVPGSYTITRVLNSSKDKVSNSRIKFVPGQGFTVDNKKFFQDLTTLITSLKHQLQLTAACGGSQYADLFKVTEGEEEEEGGNYHDIVQPDGSGGD